MARNFNLKTQFQTLFKMLIASNFEPSQNIRFEKVSHLGVLSRDRDLEPI